MTKLQRGAFTIVLGAVLAAGGFGAYKWVQSRKKMTVAEREVPTAAEVLSAPPFSTKEPNRYQATRIITSVARDGDEAASPRVTRILIARDGDRRREDYDSDTDLHTSYLELPAGTFVLLHARKVYAELKPASGSLASPNQGSNQQRDGDADFSPETLLNETTGARYEKLGSEKLDGRTAVKYRITANAAASGTDAPNITLIWVDEALGMPIKSETEDADDNHHSKVTSELRAIQLQVDPKLFELPGDFRRVADFELRDLLGQVRKVTN